MSCSAFEKKKLRWVDLEFAPYVVVRGQVTSPFFSLPAQRILPASETMSYDLASATYVREYTHCNARLKPFFVIWITVLLLVLRRITCITITQACVKLLFGEKTKLRRVL